MYSCLYSIYPTIQIFSSKFSCFHSAGMSSSSVSFFNCSLLLVFEWLYCRGHSFEWCELMGLVFFFWFCFKRLVGSHWFVPFRCFLCRFWRLVSNWLFCGFYWFRISLPWSIEFQFVLFVVKDWTVMWRYNTGIAFRINFSWQCIELGGLLEIQILIVFLQVGKICNGVLFFSMVGFLVI